MKFQMGLVATDAALGEGNVGEGVVTLPFLTSLSVLCFDVGFSSFT